MSSAEHNGPDRQTAPYEALARTIERELDLICTRDYDALAAVKAERDALIATLPQTPPASARPALQRAALMNKRLEIEILRLREALLLDAANVERVGRTARGYSPPREARGHVEASA
ncbi:MAG TPA: hypothetical protein VMB27_09425 [Solirubrobacteraceae bacterium]|nr:hypothetical protein [Solirubrobacteraceae bacterium]